jgi:hypothetical protein
MKKIAFFMLVVATFIFNVQWSLAEMIYQKNITTKQEPEESDSNKFSILNEARYRIDILLPTNGEFLSTPTVVVKGMVSGNLVYRDKQVEFGVTVNRIPAAVRGETWAAEVPLVEGQNIITARITLFSGKFFEKSIPVTVVPAEFIMTEALPNSGIAPLAVTFKLISAPETSRNCRIDFEGDAVMDQDIVNEISHKYDKAGIYIPTVICGEYRTENLIEVFRKDKLDAHLRSRWKAMRSSLKEKKIKEAVRNFTSESQEVYQAQFQAFKGERILSQYVQELESSQINFINAQSNMALYEILVNREGNRFSFSLEFIRDTDGIWRISRY